MVAEAQPIRDNLANETWRNISHATRLHVVMDATWRLAFEQVGQVLQQEEEEQVEDTTWWQLQGQEEQLLQQQDDELSMPS